MNALRKEQVVENELGTLLMTMTSNSEVLQNFLSEKNEETFVEKYNVSLTADEMIALKNLKKEIIQSVNQNIMGLSEKVSKITNKRMLCNGTCW